MQSVLDAAWDLFFALDTTVLRKFTICPDIQAQETPDISNIWFTIVVLDPWR